MGNNKIRVSKQPDKRRQEIMDTAMQVFTEKGYEAATMRDIAAAVGVVPGLCYRYFESKQKLYQETVKKYTEDYCMPLIVLFEKSKNSTQLRELISDQFADLTGKEKYHAFFHKPENKEFAVLLKNSICEYLFPSVCCAIERFTAEGNSSYFETESLARFFIFGQAAVLDNDDVPLKQRLDTINKIFELIFGNR